AFRSIDFGTNWLNARAGVVGTHITGIGITNNNGMAVSTQFDGAFTTIDGVNWVSGGSGLPAIDPVTTIEVISQSGNTVFAGTAGNGAYKSTNGGDTFFPTGTSTSGIMDFLTKPNGTVYAGGAGPNVQKSTNAGMTWSQFPLPLSTNIRGIEEATNGDLFAFTGNFPGGPFGGNGVYKSTTGGQSWPQWGLQFTSFIGSDRSSDNKLLGTTDLNAVVENDGVSSSWFSAPLLTAGVKIRYSRFYERPSEPLREILGASGGFYHRTAFSSDPWIKNSPLGEFEVSFLTIRNAGGMSASSFAGQIILGTYGGGVFQSTSPLTSVGENKIIPGQFALEQNYPNPFNPSTKIVYRVKSREFIELRVFDVLGREVTTLVNEVKSPGEYSVDFEGRGLSSGVYFYRMTTSDFVQTKKLILLR
ncbi:MAG: hypothetical protein HW407_1541, partial [Bacteroidetes bacterium]|nr:hypothetical protein [Bacteroidota bacterium]